MVSSKEDVYSHIKSFLKDDLKKRGREWSKLTFTDSTAMTGGTGAFYAAMHPDVEDPVGESIEGVRVDTGNLIGSIREEESIDTDSMEFAVGWNDDELMRPKGYQYSRKQKYNKQVPHKDQLIPYYGNDPDREALVKCAERNLKRVFN